MQRSLLVLAILVGCTRSSPKITGFDEGNALPRLDLEGVAHRVGVDAGAPIARFDDASAVGEGAAAPRLLLVHTVMAWCGHCIQETDAELKMVERAGHALGIIQVLVQDEYGDPAKQDLVQRWITMRRSTLPTGTDVTGALGRRFPSAATFILVDLADHRRIRYVGAGPKGFEEAKARAGDALGIAF